MKIINRICPKFTKGLDDRLSVGNMNPNAILTLRGLYDSTHENPLIPPDVKIEDLTDEDINKYSQILVEFKKEVNREDIKAQEDFMLGSNGTTFAQALLTLDGEYDGSTKIRRIDMIAELAYQCVVAFQSKYGLNNMSYQDIINTYFDNGKGLFYPLGNIPKKFTVYGQLYLRKQKAETRLNWLKENDSNNSEITQLEHIVSELNKILDSETKIYPALCVYATSKLKESLDVKISTDFSYSIANEDDPIAEEEDHSIVENSTKESWQEVSKASFNWLSKPTRKVLFMINKYKVSSEDGSYTSIVETDDLGFPIYNDALELHRSLLDILVYVDSEESMMAALLEASKTNPAYKELITRLNADPALKSDFLQGYLSFTHIDYVYMHEDGSIRNLSGMMSNKKTVFKNWLNKLDKKKQVYSNSIFEVINGKTIINKEKFKAFKQFLKENFEPAIIKVGILQSKGPSKFSKLSVQDKKEVLSQLLTYLNIDFTPKVIEHLIARNNYRNVIKEALKLATNEDWLDENNIDKGTASSHLTSTINGYSFVKDTISNILYSIAKSNPKRLEHKVNWLGKKLFNDILPSLTSDIIDTFKRFNHTENLSKVRDFLESKYFVSSQFYDPKEGVLNRVLADIYESIYPSDYKGQKDFQLEECAKAIIDTMNICRNLGTTEKEFQNFTTSEHLEVLMSGFFNNYKNDTITYITEEEYMKSTTLNPYMNYYIIGKPYYYKGVSKRKYPRHTYADYSLFIAGDANQLKTVTLPIYSYEECIEALYKLALSEINYYKQRLAANEKLGKDDFRTDRIFGFLSSLNNNKELVDFAKGKIDAEDLSLPIKDLIKKEIESFIDSENTKLEERLNKNPETKALFESITANSFKDDKVAARKFFAANYAVALGTTLQLTMISPTLFENVKDLQKRNKGQHSNGKKLHTRAYNKYLNQYFTAEDAYQKVKILEEQKVSMKDLNPDFYTYVVSLFGSEDHPIVKNYRGVKLTDGQGLRSVDSYYKIRCMMGESSDPKLNAWYAKYKELQKRMFEEGRDSFTQEEIKEWSDIGYIPQPLKPITQAINHFKINDNDTMLVAQQHKYAEIPLIPEMLPKDSRLKAIAETMRGDWNTDKDDIIKGKAKIDLVIFDSGVKVGAFGTEKVIFKEDGSQYSYDEVKENVNKAYTHNVSLEYTRVQTNLPYHVLQARLLGSQIRKIMLAGINRNANYSNIFEGFSDFENKGYTTIRTSKNRTKSLNFFTGNDFIELYNAIVSAGYVESFSKFKQLIKNTKELSRTLINSTILGARGNINDVLAYTPDATGEGFYTPLFDPIREHDTSSLLLSLFKKMVNKQIMLGGSAVQASSFGISSLEEKDSLKYKTDSEGNVTWTQGELTWDFEITNADGSKTPLDYDTYCNEDGTLKTNEKGEYLLDIDYPGARFIIIYRTPTESFYSIMLVEIVRFTRPVSTGGIMKLSPEGIAQIGFDFDADKVSFVRKEFKEKKPYFKRLQLTNQQREDIMVKAKELYPEFVKEVEPIQEASFSQSQLYDIFANIYDEYNEIYEDLKRIRTASGEYHEYKDHTGKTKTSYDHPLNYYFNQSKKAINLANKKGFDSVEEYKAYLVQQAADNLGYVPDTYTVVKDGYLMLNEEAIKQAGLTKKDIFEHAAKELNIQLKENVNERFEEYDPNKTPLENSKVARNNLLFHLFKARMLATDTPTAKMKLTTGGFDNARKAGRFLRELIFNYKLYKDKNNLNIKDINTISEDPEPNYNPLSVDTLITYNEMNQIADKLIGVFANHNSNTIMSSLMYQLELNTNNQIVFGRMLEDVTLMQGDKDVTKQKGSWLLADTIIYPDGTTVDIGNSVHELIAASVDAVKDPVLNYLGLTPVTATAGALLARLGYTFEDIGLLFNQPIIKQVLLLSETEPMDSVISDMISDFKTVKAYPGNITTSMLINSIVDKTPLKERADLSQQLAILNLFKHVMNMSAKVNNFVGITKNTSANSVASSFAQIYNDEHKVSKTITEFAENPDVIAKPSDKADVPIINDLDLASTEDYEEYLESILDTPYAYEQAAYDCNKGVSKATSSIHPYETDLYKSIRKTAYEMSLYDVLDNETIDEIHNDIVIKTLSTRGNSYFNPFREYKDTYMFDYIIEEFPSQLYDFLLSAKGRAIASKYPILEMLEFSIVEDDTTETVSYSFYIPGYKDGLKDSKYLIASMFSDLINSEDKAVRDLGLLIILYSYYTRGFGYGSTSFSEIFGPSVMHNLVINEEGETYSDILNMLLDGTIDINPKELIIQFVQNHPHNNKFVYNVSSRSALKEIKDSNLFLVKEGTNIQELTLEQATKKLRIANATEEKGVFKPKSFIMIGGSLWLYTGPSLVDSTSKITYEEIPIFGNKGVRKLYGSEVESSLVDMKLFERLYNSEIVASDVQESKQFEDNNELFTGAYVATKLQEYFSNTVSEDQYEEFDLKLVLMATLEQLNSNIFGDTSSLTEDEQTALINQLYNSLSLKNIVNLLTEEYNKIGEIKVLDENGNLTTLC